MNLMQEIKLSICIVAFNRPADLGAALSSVFRYCCGLRPEIIVVDNGSTVDVSGVVSTFPGVRLERTGRNIGYAAAMNIALRESHGRYILTLSHDAELKAGSARALIEFMDSHPRAGLAGPRTLDANGQVVTTLHHPNLLVTVWTEIVPIKPILRSTLWLRRLATALFRNTSGLTSDYTMTRQARVVDGGCILARREFLETVGLLDQNIPQGPDDYDWCFRAHQNGFEVWFVGESEIVHRQKLPENIANLSPEYLRIRLPQFCYLYGKYHSGLRHRFFCVSAYLLVQKGRLESRRHWPGNHEYDAALREASTLCLDQERYLREVPGLLSRKSVPRSLGDV
jgi:GT2 family glycosyltransferase